MTQFATLATNFNPEKVVAASHTPDPFAPAIEYGVDAAQRTILFWDVMRQRGNQFTSTWLKPRRTSSATKPSSSSTAARSSAPSITGCSASSRPKA